MHFLPDVYIQCDECKGTRYNRETLEIKFKDKSIADVLNMTVDEGCEYFENISNIKTKLLTLKKSRFRLYKNRSTSYYSIRR